jgi:flagellar protein FlaI
MRAPGKRTESPPDDTRPCFTSTWLERGAPGDGATLATYVVNGVPVRVSSADNRTSARYDLFPPEYDLSPATVKVVAEVISEITSAPPEGLDLGSLSVLRPFIKARAKDMIYSRLASRRSPSRSSRLPFEVESLAELVSKYTAGYGVLETLFEDRAVNAPSSQTPVHVVLRSDVLERVGQKCRTNIFIGRADLQGLVSRIKLETGMPFSEAQPVLEADIPRLGCRVTLVGPPISDEGVSLAFRKHSTEVLTLPSLIAKDSLSPLLASFLWACVLGRRAVLVAGSRGAGKTTLLGALMLEFPLTQRILLIEDTPEIPVRRMRQLGYDIQTLRFGGGQGTHDISAEDTLRVSLRMGESAIVIGEVRGSEARVLYESMRAGSAGSSVLGTIHGNSAKGVLDRAVEDLGVSERAFSSTDIVVVIGLIRTPDGSAFHRKVVEVAEVRHGVDGTSIVDLFSMQPGCSCAKPTEAFSEESKTVQGIAAALGVTSSAVLDIVRRRAHVDQVMASDLLSTSRRVGPQGDAIRVESNEVLVRTLFAPEGPDAAIMAWEEMHGKSAGEV